jgi:FtsP/CotA-like multicopper oxidase with cupredoxin domain
MGPLIRGAVGDTIKVVFRNRLSDNTVSIHPHGVWYDKDSEGSPYADGAPGELTPGGAGPRPCGLQLDRLVLQHNAHMGRAHL